MPRPFARRMIGFEPGVTYFKPVGIRISELEEVSLKFDELEALRLQNVENMSQESAANKMNISQPTFHRILIEARKKITDALVNGKAIRIESGNNFQFCENKRKKFRRGEFL